MDHEVRCAKDREGIISPPQQANAARHTEVRGQGLEPLALGTGADDVELEIGWEHGKRPEQDGKAFLGVQSGNSHEHACRADSEFAPDIAGRS